MGIRTTTMRLSDYVKQLERYEIQAGSCDESEAQRPAFILHDIPLTSVLPFARKTISRPFPLTISPPGIVGIGGASRSFFLVHVIASRRCISIAP